MIMQGQFQEDFFQKLKVREITCFHDEFAIFPFDVLERFHSMEKLVVMCSEFRELFPHEECVGNRKYVDTICQMRHLKLRSLASLKHIWNQDSQLDRVLQSLEILEVAWCHSLITLAPSSASFLNLTTMDIKECKGLSSLMTSSTARSLVQLTKLSINDCKSLTEIVANESNDCSKQEITFDKLESLQLVCLPTLFSFCSAQHNFSFPSLTQVIVEQCPKMQLFSNGVLSTPNLRTLQGRWNDNLNATIRQLFIEVNSEET